MEKEKELVLSDLRRIMAEKEALKDKLKVSNKIALFLKGILLRKIEILIYVFLWSDYLECTTRSGVDKQRHMSQMRTTVFLYDL